MHAAAQTEKTVHFETEAIRDLIKSKFHWAVDAETRIEKKLRMRPVTKGNGRCGQLFSLNVEGAEGPSEEGKS